MQLLLIPIKDPESILLKLNQKQIPHDTSSPIKKLAQILILIVVIDEPSKSLINPHYEIVQVVVAAGVIVHKLS